MMGDPRPWCIDARHEIPCRADCVSCLRECDKHARASTKTAQKLYPKWKPPVEVAQ